MSQAIPTIEQINRLKSLQGIDSGTFTLAVFSTFEAYFRSKLQGQVDNNTKFWELIDLYKAQYTKHHPKEYKLFRDIQFNQKNTNKVRHNFENLSVEEANAAIYLLNEFAQIFQIPNQDKITLMTKTLDAWNLRKSPAETAKELEHATKEITRLTELNSNMASKVAELEQKKNDLKLLSAKLTTLQMDYDQQIEKNKQNKERIDELRRQKNEVEMENRKAQKDIQEQIAKLSDAEEYITNLSRMTSYTRTRYDFEQSLVHLTNEQQSIVNMIKFNKDFLIKGSAGTGKSLVLLKTLEKLIEKNQQSLFNGNKTIKLITFTHSLEKYNKYVAELLDIENPMEEEIISTSESYVSKILTDAFPDVTYSYGITKCLEDSPEVSENPLGKDIWNELEKFILPKCVTKKEYCEDIIKRTGMKKAQGSENRKKIWKAVEAIFSKWDEEKDIPKLYAIYKLVQKIEKGEYKIPQEFCTDYLFVDEAQDLSAATLRLIRSSVKESMILSGDYDQSVFQPGFTWSRAGIDITGNTKILNINFRSTNQINEVAEKYRSLIKGSDKTNRPETFRIGPPVELHENKDQNSSFQQMLSSVNMCINSLNYEPENICIITPKKDLLEKFQTLLKEELDLDSALVNSPDFDFSKKGIIRLATTQSCKGLDFPVVLFYLDHRAHFLTGFDEETADKMNRNMIYTALTRSIELLQVFMLETCSEGPLGDLKKILK